VSHAQDTHHGITDDAIPNDVGIRRHQLSHVTILHATSAMREMRKAVTGWNQTFDQLFVLNGVYTRWPPSMWISDPEI
jgi:hypothetical protein